MSEKESKIRVLFKTPSDNIMCMPLNRYDEYLKKQPGYKPPKPMTNKEKIDWLVQPNNIGFNEGVLTGLFKIDRETEHLVCLELEKEGIIERRKEKDGVLCAYIKQDKNKILEIIEKYINK